MTSRRGSMSDRTLAVRDEGPFDWSLGSACRHQGHCAEQSVSTRRAILLVFVHEISRIRDELPASTAEPDPTDRLSSATGGAIARELSPLRNFGTLQTADFVPPRLPVARASASQRVATILSSCHPISVTSR